MIRPALLRSRRWTPGSTARRSPPAFWAVALLVCSLLWAQAAGVMHRIEHLGGPTTPHASVLFGPAAASASASADADASSHEASPASLHSCVLFDGLCMADSLPTAVLPALVLRQVAAMPPAAIFASWHALFVSHFLSRGPPAA